MNTDNVDTTSNETSAPDTTVVASSPVVATDAAPAKAKGGKKGGKKNKGTKAKGAAKEGSVKQGVGRPRLKISFPKGRFTFHKLAIHNGVLDKDGNETNDEKRPCLLTLRNALKNDMFKKTGKNEWTPNPRSEFVVVKGENGKSKTGKGRKPLIYMRRAELAAENASSKTKKNSSVSVSVDPAPSAAPSESVSVTAPAPETVTA